MAQRSPRTRPRFRLLGNCAFALTYVAMRAAGALARLHSHGRFTKRAVASVREALERGETVYILGIGAGGHNAGVGLIEASKARGIRLLANHEEERFRALKHFQRFPHQSVDQAVASMKVLGIDRTTIDFHLTIVDPKTYSKTWETEPRQAKLKPGVEIPESFCVASEEEEFAKRIRAPAARKTGK